MVVKPLDDIIGQSTTETMNKMVEQMIQMVAPVKTTAWGGCHRSLTLVLDDADYSSITKVKITSTMPVTQPGAINKVITDTSTPLKILTLQEETKKLQKKYDLQEAAANIGVQRIINSIKEKYVKQNSTKSTTAMLTTPSKPSSPSLVQLVQGHDMGAQGHHQGILSSMGSKHDPHHYP